MTNALRFMPDWIRVHAKIAVLPALLLAASLLGMAAGCSPADTPRPPAAPQKTSGAAIGVAPGVQAAEPVPAAPAERVGPLRKAWVSPKPGAVEAVVTRLVGQMMPRFHYAHLPTDEALSEKLFQAYFDRLDPDRSFFLASDLNDFAEDKQSLCDLMQQGKSDFAYRVYERLIQRVRERLAFVRACVREPQDFTRNEEILIDRSKEPWCADRADLDALWRLKVKNQLLSYMLMDEAQKAERAKKEKEKKADPAAAEPPPMSLKPPTERVVRFYERILDTLEENESMDILEIYLNAFSMLYDPHSNYMAPASEEDFNISMKLSLQGIGAVLTSEDGYVKVVEVVPGGPAALDGRLHEGDRIIGVAQEGKESVEVINMPLNKVVRQIRGAKGTKVFLTVLPAAKGLNGLPSTITIKRDEVKLTEQEAKSEIKDLPGNGAKAAVISLPSFYTDFDSRRDGNKDYKSASRDVRRLLEEAEKAKVAGVILDLRSDGGGSLDEAISLTGLFVPRGPVVQVRNAEQDLRIQSCTTATPLYTGPLVVLVNRLSASASEIVAAALQDYHRAVIVGEQSTHGKGTVQTVYHLDDVVKRFLTSKRTPGSLKFTLAKFYRINGGSTQRKGVLPDVVLPSFTDHMDLGESRLPNALAWDEIAPLPIQPVSDVRPFLPLVKEHAAARMAGNPEMQSYVAAVKRYGELREAKTIPLNRAKREAFQKEEEDFSKTIQAISMMNRSKSGAKKDKDEPPPKDLMLEEALNILADLASLEKNPPPLLAASPDAAAKPADTIPAAKGK